jgi:hypothetical protein
MRHIMSMGSRHSVLMLSAACALLASSQIASATIYNPFSYTPLGMLDTTSATSVSINTNGASPTITVTTSSGHTTYTGVFDSQNGMGGVGGAPNVAVFDFNAVNFAANVPVTITGSNGLAILSVTNFTANTALTLNGQTGANGSVVTSTPTSSPAGGTGGAGGFAGGNGGIPLITFPNLQQNGDGNGSTPGNGPGGGHNAGSKGLYTGDAGGGGGFGSAGGQGNFGVDNVGDINGFPQGGNAYGLTSPIGTLTPLYGGSGGAGGNYVNSAGAVASGAGGGGGGGAIEIVALGNVTLNNGISTNGGAGGAGGGFAGSGGGGSGGQIILVGNTVSVTGSATTNGGSSPGNGGPPPQNYPGGGGGGGRILVDSASTPSGTFTASGVPIALYGSSNGTVQEITSAVSVSAPNLLHRRGTTGSGNLTITTSGTAGSVVFADFLAPSGFGTHVAGLPAKGNTFALDPFTPTESFTLTDTTTTAKAAGTLSFVSNVGTVNIPVTYGAAGPQFSSTPAAGGAINFGTVDIGSSKTINLTIGNSSLDLGGTDASSLTQLDITGYSLLVSQNGSLVPVTQSIFAPQSMPSGPIYEGGSYVVPLIFTPNDNVSTTEVLQIDTDVNGPVGSSTTTFSYTLTGTGQNPLLGDANFDGIVNNTDLQILQNGETKDLTGWSNGDFNEDGVINADDFALYAKGLAEYNAGLASVPEPAEIAVLSLLILLSPRCSQFRRDSGL